MSGLSGLSGKPDLSCGAGSVYVLVGIWVGAVAVRRKGGIVKIVLCGWMMED